MCEANTETGRSEVIWTIGHSTRTIQEFIDLLRHYQIENVIDVRHFPGSRRFLHFNKVAMQKSLPMAGIHYEHLAELGGRRPVQPGSRNIAWRNASFRGYVDYMETSRSTMALLASGKSPAPAAPRSCVLRRFGSDATVR